MMVGGDVSCCLMWANTQGAMEKPGIWTRRAKKNPALVAAFSMVERRAANPKNEMVTH
jgi:hypothetical protein